MGTILAPYNNAMRLGQGFNSYTQQICLEGAVLPPSKEPTAELQADQVPAAEGVSQIVSYSSRFVDKLSDVTDAMNISASLSIKTATIGGKASGSFIDSDKFKESDLNFFIQVKVTNQTRMAKDYTEFQKLSTVPQTKFTDVYGDTYISGWEEGGELNALVSVKVSDKNKTFQVKAELEASLGTPALSGEVNGKIDMSKEKIETSTETTVTVNWSGGGQIKDTNVLWDVNSLTLAAANFPELVAKTPQRTYAILKRYTALKSFHEQMPGYAVQDYENAGIYTSALLDSYMDYKSIWKQIQLASFELQNQRADIYLAKPPPEILALQSSTPDQFLRHPPSATGSDMDSSGQLVSPSDIEDSKNSQALAKPKGRTFKPNVIKYEPYPATTLGLDKARKDCRLEMIKIVNEVDEVTRDPDLALDADREGMFVSPAVFKRLLPVVKLRPVDMPPDSATPPNPLILGISDESSNKVLYDEVKGKPYSQAQTYIAQLKHKAPQFHMGSTWVGDKEPSASSVFFNDLEVLDSTYVPKKVTVWYTDDCLVGLTTDYHNGKQIAHGDCSGDQLNVLEIGQSDKDRIDKIFCADSQIDDKWCIDTIAFLDSASVRREAVAPKRASGRTSCALNPPATGYWSFRGFWGSCRSEMPGISTLSVVWGRESQHLSLKEASVPPSSSPPSAATDGQPENLCSARAIERMPDAVFQASLTKHKSRSSQFRLGDNAGRGTVPEDVELDKKNGCSFFNFMDSLESTWVISKIDLYHEKETNLLRGIFVQYTNGQVLSAGEKTDNALNVPVPNDEVLLVEMEVKDSAVGLVTLFLVAATKTAGPLSDLTIGTLMRPLQYGSNGGNITRWAFWKAETPGRKWVLKGFYGTVGAGGITRLGPVWGTR